MNNYKQLALKYLKINKNRSIITILGVMMGTMVLYLLLNLGWSALLNQRKVIREDRDYEIVLFTETSEQIEQIMKDAKVKSAQAGDYNDYDYYEPKVYKNALFINTTNPYKTDAYFQYFKDTYQVEGELNYDLVYTYMQGTDDNLVFIMVLTVLLFSMIFAIFCVGIVRSSIQMSTLEQIKDYGNLRCIGASKGQLKKLVYVEGAVLEVIGMVLGVILASFISMFIGYRLGFRAGFHAVPLIPILIAFLGDWYFAMEENCKVIVNLTPISAIRGEYRIRKEKIKVRRKSIFGKLFGVEGDYAYKSLMRNKGRFYKTVWALGFCVATFMAAAGCLTSIWSIRKNEEEKYGYYQVFFASDYAVDKTVEKTQGQLPSMDRLQRIHELDGMTEAKRIYTAEVFLQDREDYYSHFSEDELIKRGMKEVHDKYKYNETINIRTFGTMQCTGLDEADYRRYESVLEEGTLDVSENGIVIMNGGKYPIDDGEYLIPHMEETTFTNYKVGETIDIVDMEQYRELFKVETERLSKEFESKYKELEAAVKSGKTEEFDEDGDSVLEELEWEYQNKKNWEGARKCYKQLLAEGAYKTYTVEGIVSEDVLNGFYGGCQIILPLDKYYKLTDTDESMSSGIQYHFDKFSYSEYLKAWGYNAEDYEVDYYYFESDYPFVMGMFEGLEKVNYGIILVIIFIVIMTTFNVVNTTIGNLHLRRKELAQLRVIGISKDGLAKIVMLEGVIESIAANIVGVILGVFLSWGFYRLTITTMFGFKYEFPFLVMIIAMFMTTIILCGSVYYALRGLKQDVAADLATGGD